VGNDFDSRIEKRPGPPLGRDAPSFYHTCCLGDRGEGPEGDAPGVGLQDTDGALQAAGEMALSCCGPALKELWEERVVI